MININDETVKALNEKFEKFFNQDTITVDYRPMTFYVADGPQITILDKENEEKYGKDGFVPTSGAVLDIKPLSESSDSGVYRGLIGGYLAIRMVDCDQTFVLHMSQYITHALSELTRGMGNLLTRKVVMSNYDDGKSYFKDLYGACLEFKVIVKKKD